MRINISISEETAEKLKAESIKRYGNMRSVSKLIEDLVEGIGTSPPEMKIEDGKFIVVQTPAESFVAENDKAAVSLLRRRGHVDDIRVSEVVVPATEDEEWQVAQVPSQRLLFELMNQVRC